MYNSAYKAMSFGKQEKVNEAAKENNRGKIYENVGAIGGRPLDSKLIVTVVRAPAIALR